MILCDEQAEPGGALLDGGPAHIDGQAAGDWLARTVADLAGHPRVRLLARTTAFGYFAHNFIALAERCTDHLAEPPAGGVRERLWQVRAREVVLAAGAIEQPLVFPGNDRPGVMLAGAARSYLKRYGVRAGTRAVLVTATDAAYLAALDLHAAGVAVAAIADLRRPASGTWAEAARRAGIEVLAGAAVEGTRGGGRVSGIDDRGPDDRLRPGADVRRLRAFGASLLAVARPAHLQRLRALFCPVAIGGARTLRGRLPRRLRARGRARGRGRGRRCGRESLRAGGSAHRYEVAAARRPARGARRHAARTGGRPRRPSWISRTT